MLVAILDGVIRQVEIVNYASGFSLIFTLVSIRKINELTDPNTTSPRRRGNGNGHLPRLMPKSALLLWLTHSESAVGNMRKEIEELELKDFAYLVNYRLAQEGLSLFDYLEWFFGECLLGSIGLLTADKTKRPTRDKLDKHANLIEGAYDGRTEKIAELYHRARIDTNLDPAHMRMGDLYLTKSDADPTKIWALLTPDCDLIVRNGKRAVDRFLLVEGGLQAYNAPKLLISVET